jgi:hypothetical protein
MSITSHSDSLLAGIFFIYEVTQIIYKNLKVALLSINVRFIYETTFLIYKTVCFVFNVHLLSIKCTSVYTPARIIYKLNTQENLAPAQPNPIRPHPMQPLFHCRPCPARACKALSINQQLLSIKEYVLSINEYHVCL